MNFSIYLPMSYPKFQELCGIIHPNPDICCFTHVHPKNDTSKCTTTRHFLVKMRKVFQREGTAGRVPLPNATSYAPQLQTICDACET